jgi:hypothetical protein
MRKLKRNILKTGDYILILAVLCLIAFLFSRFYFSKSGARQVNITGNSFQGSFPGDENRVIDVEGPLGVTRVIIEDGEVWVEESPCREKICIKMGKIKRAGEQIVCVPNRVIVEIEGEREAVDGITR